MSASGIARNDGSQNVHFIGKDIAFNTVGIGTADTVKVGRIPAGSWLLANVCSHHVTAFNAATTNVLTVGQNATANTDIVAAGEVNEGAAGNDRCAHRRALTFASDTDIYVRYTQTGTAATAGAATIVITYIPPNW
jgi:hypothetical protein